MSEGGGLKSVLLSWLREKEKEGIKLLREIKIGKHREGIIDYIYQKGGEQGKGYSGAAGGGEKTSSALRTTSLGGHSLERNGSGEVRAGEGGGFWGAT